MGSAITTSFLDDEKPSRRALLAFGGAAFGSVMLANVAARSASASVEAVQRYYDQLAKVTAAGASTVRARYEALAPVMDSAFDFATMTRLAVGPAWAKATPAQQTAARDAFARLLEAFYASRVGEFAGGQFKVEPQPEARGADEIVRTSVITAKSGTIAIGYLMRNARIIDVYSNGAISEVASRRGQFEQAIKGAGMDGLTEMLRANAGKMLGG